VLGSRDRLVQAESAAPECLVAEGVIAEGLSAFSDHPFRILIDLPIVLEKFLYAVRRRCQDERQRYTPDHGDHDELHDHQAAKLDDSGWMFLSGCFVWAGRPGFVTHWSPPFGQLSV
jgi:hypothetical protein